MLYFGTMDEDFGTVDEAHARFFMRVVLGIVAGGLVEGTVPSRES